MGTIGAFHRVARHILGTGRNQACVHRASDDGHWLSRVTLGYGLAQHGTAKVFIGT